MRNLSKILRENIVKANKWFILIIIMLLVTVGFFYLKYKSSEYSLILYKSVPRIALTNTLSYSSGDNLYHGYINGFVVFDNINNQPHGLGQYYIIKPLNKVDKNLDQIFSLEEIFAYDNLPPYTTANYELTKINNLDTVLILDDSYGNRFFINKSSKEITMTDRDGDETTLITNNSKYENFMRDFLTK